MLLGHTADSLRGTNRYIFLFPPSGEGACVVQRTLPRKKPDAIDRIILFSAPMASVFLTPLPIRKVCPDAILLRANRGIKPLVTLSFMDYIFYDDLRRILFVCFAGVDLSPAVGRRSFVNTFSFFAWVNGANYRL
jgi:hypothetical protein